MFRSFLALLVVLLAGAPSAAFSGGTTAYDFEFTAIEGTPLPLSGYRGKALLVVNTASLCGYTPQYDALQEVWEQYRDQGLIVLGVPSNDFGNQEPGTEAEIKQFCEVNFSIDFPMTTKERVRGTDAHPLYRWALTELGSDAAPKWNFHKFLIGRDGRLVGWFPTAVEPTAPSVTKAIEATLAASPPTH